MTSRAPLRIADTRRGDDVGALLGSDAARLAGGSQPIVAIETERVDWAPFAARLDEILGTASEQPFAICEAWWPGTRQTEAAVARAFPGAGLVGNAFLAVRSPGPFVGDVLAVRDRQGGVASGTWTIGTCASLDGLCHRLRTRPGALPPVSLLAIELFDLLHGALCIDEPQAGSVLVARVVPANAAAVDALCRELQAP